ncbi:MAG: tetratricopeptide repeat protein [Gallionellaceae bacterium]|nr:tetratricopeptide repeat protein [Gallionellaceae bacterium]
MRKDTYDVRMRALALTIIPIIAGGLAIAYLPGWLNMQTISGAKEDHALHAREKAEIEIQQRFQQGVNALNTKQYEQALSDFHRVLQLSPTMPEAHVNSGFALVGLGRYALARDFFEGALALRKNQVNAYYGLAEALEGLNDLPGAIGAMRTYLHLAPANDHYRRKAEAALWEWEAKMAEIRAREKQAKADKAGKKN